MTGFAAARIRRAIAPLGVSLVLASTAALPDERLPGVPDRPNVILIMADDLGYGDLSCYGQRHFATPHLDRLAREGMRFTDFYAGSTVCAPSRCVLMTGYHTGHCQIRGNARQPLRPQDLTVAEVLRQAGYRTGLFGKWGLGEEGSTGYPTRKGFDEFFGYANQHHAHNYYPSFLLRGDERIPLRNVVPDENPVGSGRATEKVEYSHDLIIREAFDFVARQPTGKPFFLFLSLTIPHANNEAGQEGMEVPDLGAFAALPWPAARQAHAAMITHMDRDIGRLRAELEKQGLERNTLILFSSDNGPHNEGGYRATMNDSSGPLRGTKRDLYEGGIRVPLIACWPGTIPAGTVSDRIGGFQDVMPTLAVLARAEAGLPADIDGISFVPTLVGENARQRQHDVLYWAFYERGCAQAVRGGRWKLVEQPFGTPAQLFDLAEDPGEKNDVATEHPEVVERLKAALAEAYRCSDDWRFPAAP